MNDSDDMQITMSDTKSPAKNSKKKIHKAASYLVEEILEKKKMNNQWMYLIKWEGFPFDQSTWEPRKNIENLGEYLEEFDKKWDNLLSSRNILRNSPNSKKKSKKIAKKVIRKDSSSSEKDLLKGENVNIKEKMRDKSNDTDERSGLIKETINLTSNKSSKKQIENPSSKGKDSNSSRKKLAFKTQKKIIPSKRTSPRKRIKTVSNNSTNHISIINNIGNVEEEKRSGTRPFGSIDIDTPDGILDFKVDDFRNYSFLISWKKRLSVKPKPSYVNTYDLEKNHNQLLFEFYRKAFYQYAKIRNLVSNPLNSQVE